MTNHIFQDALAKTIQLEIDDSDGRIAIQGSGSRLVVFTRPEDRPAIAAAIHTPEPMFKPNATFDDIRKGDTVRVITEEHGVIVTREGTVHELYSYWWRNAEGTVIAPSPEAASYLNPTIHILSRHTPQLPTQPGSAIWIVEGQCESGTFTNTSGH